MPLDYSSVQTQIEVAISATSVTVEYPGVPYDHKGQDAPWIKLSYTMGEEFKQDSHGPDQLLKRLGIIHCAIKSRPGRGRREGLVVAQEVEAILKGLKPNGEIELGKVCVAAVNGPKMMVTKDGQYLDTVMTAPFAVYYC